VMVADMLSTKEMNAELHSKTLDPVVDEILRILKILQNEDGSWGTQENEFDRAFTTSWALRAIHELGESNVETKGVVYFKKILEDISYAPADNFSRIARENFLKGFFNCAKILLNSPEIDPFRLKESYLTLLNLLEQRNWLSSISVVSYVLFGLKDVGIGSEFQKRATDILKKEVSFSRRDLVDLTPDVCLAMPDLLYDFIREPTNFLEKVESLSDMKIVHILIALELLEKVDRSLTSNLRSHILERFRRRQITEIDKKITKQLLDLTLLMRSGLRGHSLREKLQKFTSLISIESESPSEILFKVKLDKLAKDFGDLNVNALASYVTALSLSKEQYVYLLSPSQYNLIKDFFRQNTIPIPQKRELVFEIMTLGFFLTSFFSALFGLAQLTTYLGQEFAQLGFLKGNEWSLASLISVTIFGLVFWKIKRVFKVLRVIVKRS